MKITVAHSPDSDDPFEKGLIPNRVPVEFV